LRSTLSSCGFFPDALIARLACAALHLRPMVAMSAFRFLSRWWRGLRGGVTIQTQTDFETVNQCASIAQLPVAAEGYLLLLHDDVD